MAFNLGEIHEASSKTFGSWAEEDVHITGTTSADYDVIQAMVGRRPPLALRKIDA